MNADWQRLFPDADHRPAMGLRRGEADAFWQDWDASGGTARERQRWLREAPDLYSASMDGAGRAMAEALAWMRTFSPAPEPDWVLLAAPGPGGPLHVMAGEVVFPSAWSLPEKLGQPLPQVHQPVPGLEASLGGSIAVFFEKLQPGPVWLRENWGLAADAERNHHPALPWRRLDAQASLETTWLRLEHQCLLRLPESRAVLFGIRVSCHPMHEIAALPGMAARLHRALASMTEPMARYKGLHEAVPPLLRGLKAGM